MQFEFDPNKSRTNKAKHGIDFEEAQALWNDSNALEAPAHHIAGEARILKIGLIGGVLWTAIFTVRANAIRIISVRKPHENEKRAYRDYNG
jgi:uncharacterized protein